MFDGTLHTQGEVLTAEAWKLWLKDESQRFLRVYRADPRRLLSDKGAELNASRDYHGREILELLQNANDAAAEHGKNSEVRVELSASGLIVANTGEPFKPTGVTSLMLANLSPKQRNGLVIGNKGLGFRAVLNWSNRPLINSGTLRLGFGPEFARIHELEIEHPVEESEAKPSSRLPTLQFPGLLENPPQGLSSAWHSILEACDECRKRYDTAIGLPFERPESLTDASAQIAALRPEVLLFVKHLDSIEIVLPGSPTRTWQITRTGQEAVVRENLSSLRSWLLWNSEGEIPPELTSPEGPRRYELAIATSRNSSSSGKLFCYFETQVAFPYPVLCHASFELDQARNHIVQGPLNAFVLKQLAVLHARVVERVADQRGGWSGGKLALCAGTPMDLYSGGDYNSQLIGELKSRRFLPCIDGELRRPREVRFVPGASPDWLPAIFGEVVSLDGLSDVAPLLLALEVRGFTEEEWRSRLEQVDLGNLGKVADLIAGLYSTGVIKSFKSFSPSILVDANGQRVKSGRIYVSGSKDRKLSANSWLSIRFLHPELREGLENRLGIQEGRELAARLKTGGFDVEEYNTAAVSGAAVAQAEAFISANPVSENTVRHELLAFLFQLFLSVREKETEFRPIARLQVPNLVGGWTPAQDAHFSQAYGEQGAITHALFASCRPKLLVAGPEHFDWVEDAADLPAFLIWIGVHPYPKSQITAERIPEFLDHAKSYIPSQFRVEGETKTVYDHAAIGTRFELDSEKVEGLADILATAPPEAILAWVARDGRWAQWAEPSKVNGAFRFTPPKAQARRTYDGPLPSHPHWLIQRSAWLVGDDGQKHAPNHMVHTTDVRLAGIIPRPGLSGAYSMSPESILSALFRVGLSDNITALSASAFYLALRKCERISPKAACSYYRYLIEERKASGDPALASSPEHRSFFREGKVWCDFRGSVELVEVRNCRYRRGDDVPKGVSQYIPLISLPVKRGPDRVENLFGVKSLENPVYQIRKFIKRDGSEQVQARLRHSADAILFHRQANGGRVERAQQEALENLSVCVCTEVTAAFIEGSTEHEIQMAAYEWVLTENNRSFYVVCPDGEDVSLRNERLVNAVVEGMASIFGIVDASVFARIIQAADDHQRLALLASLLGEAPLEIQQQLAQRRLQIQEPEAFGVVPPPVAPASTAPAVDQRLGEDALQIPPGEEAKSQTAAISGESRVRVEPVQHTAQQIRTIRLRVTQKTSEGRQLRLRQSSPASGSQAESIAEAFERSEGRFPVPVGHVQGSDGAGCDLLSFESEETAEAVRRGIEKNPFALASRIIEVKGRKDERARIILEGNELAAANKHAARYYLYRVYADEGENHWQIAVLQNPSQTYSAHMDMLLLSLEKTDATKKFRVSLANDEVADPVSEG